MGKKSEMKLTADILEKKEEGKKKKKIPFTQKVKKNVSFFFFNDTAQVNAEILEEDVFFIQTNIQITIQRNVKGLIKCSGGKTALRWRGDVGAWHTPSLGCFVHKTSIFSVPF